MSGPRDQEVVDGKKPLSVSLAEAFGFIKVHDIELIKSLMKELPDKPICVNIGAGVGTSVIAMLEARDDANVFSIDIQKAISPTGGLGNEREILERYGFVDMLARRTEIHGDSKKVGKTFHSEVDLIFVDGDHSYESCKGDLETWLPHVKEGGYIIVHDYTPNPWALVMTATDEVMKGHEVVDQTPNSIAYRKKIERRNRRRR